MKNPVQSWRELFKSFTVSMGISCSVLVSCSYLMVGAVSVDHRESVVTWEMT